jgi:hypothetical protein
MEHSNGIAKRILDRNLRDISQERWNQLTICQLEKIRIKFLNKKVIINPEIYYDLDLIESKYLLYKRLAKVNKDALKVASDEYHDEMEQQLIDDTNDIDTESINLIAELRGQISLLKDDIDTNRKEYTDVISKLERKIEIMGEEISKLKDDSILKDLEIERRKEKIFELEDGILCDRKEREVATEIFGLKLAFYGKNLGTTEEEISTEEFRLKMDLIEKDFMIEKKKKEAKEKRRILREKIRREDISSKKMATISQDEWDKLSISQLQRIRLKILDKKVIINPEIYYDLDLIGKKNSLYKKLIKTDRDALKVASNEYHDAIRELILNESSDEDI